VLVNAAILGVIASAYAATHIAMDTNTATLISPDLPWRQREIDYARMFPQRVAVIAVVVDGATPELAEQATATLAERLADAGSIIALRRPVGGPFFNRVGLLFAPTEEVARTTQQMIAAQPLLGTLAADPTLRGVMDALSLVLEGVRHGQIELDDLARPLAAFAPAFDAVNAGQLPRFSWRTLIMGGTADPRELRRFILVQPVLDFGALQPGARAVAAIRQAVVESGFAADSRVRVRLTGPVPLADEEFATLAEGAALNAMVTMLVVVVLLWLALRSGRLILAILISLLIGMAITAAFGLFVYGAFNLISVAFAVLFIGLGVDFGIQFCTCYRAKRYLHDDLQLALRDAGAEVGVPLALAGVSTAAGFYAFLPTHYRGVSELGLIAGTGMVVAFVTSITLLPALLAVLRPGGEPGAVGYAAFAPLDRFLTRRRIGILVAATLVAVGSLLLLPKLRFDFNPLNLRSAQAESVATLLDLMKSPDTTPNTIQVLAPTLGDAVALKKQLSELPEVNRALSLASFIPEHQEAKLALLADAAMLLDPALNPLDVKAPPTDEETVRAMLRTAQALEQAAGPTPADAALSRSIIADAGLNCHVSPDPESLARSLDDGAGANTVLFGEQTITYPKPFVFSLLPLENHPLAAKYKELSRVLCFYDNAGESFLPGEDTAASPVTRHLARSRALMFLFDPTQDLRFRRLCEGKTSDPQMMVRSERFAQENPVRQETILSEAALRVRRYAGIGQNQRFTRPLVVVVSKFDSWANLLPVAELPPPYSINKKTELRAVRLAAIDEVSHAVRDLLWSVSPEIVSTAESFSNQVIYIPCSATGCAPEIDSRNGGFGFRPKNLNPIWSEVPLLYIMSRWMGGLVPYVQAGKAATNNHDPVPTGGALKTDPLQADYRWKDSP
jgi:hypothetical protein